MESRSATDVVRTHTVDELFKRSRSRILLGNNPEEMLEVNAADVLQNGRRLALDLAQSGMVPGDRIAVQMENTALYLNLLAASAVGEFVLMSVNKRFSDDLASELIRRSGAVRTIRSDADLPVSAEAEPPSDAHEAQPEDRYVIFTTSGTTSAPKLVVHTQHSIAEHAGDVAATFGYTEASRVLVAMPFCGTFGLTTFMGALAGHSTIIVPTAFSTAETARLIEHYAVTSIHGSDDMFSRLDEHGARLDTITCAGYARFNSSLDGIVDRAKQRGLDLCGLYGMSEVQALFTMRPANEEPATRWLGGGALTSPDARYRVVEGELQLRGPSMFEGYLADGGNDIDAALTSTHFDDGWFRTGDLAEAESEESFRYLTRLGDVLRLGGFLVAPAEIEATVLEVPGIAAVQVVAVDLPTGARPVAFVIAEDTSVPIDEAAIIDHCQQRLARFKSPVRVITMHAFPVTDGPNGVKIQRSRLREMGTQALLG